MTKADKAEICKSGVKREPSIFRYVNLERKVKTDTVFENIGYNYYIDIAETPVSEAVGIQPVGAAPTLRTIQRTKAGVLTTARFFLAFLVVAHPIADAVHVFNKRISAGRIYFAA